MSSQNFSTEMIEANPSEKEDLENLAALLSQPGSFSVIQGSSKSKLPKSVLALLQAGLNNLIRGAATSVVPIEKELSTQQAAELLNVSRQYVVRLVDAGDLEAASTTGGHRRLLLADVLAFRTKRNLKRQASLDELEALTEEYGGYAGLKR